jgi:hypothetical protein
MTQANTVGADAQLEAMLARAESAADPSGVLGEVVSDGETPSVVAVVNEPGWTTVYQTRTGEPRVVMSQPGYLRQLLGKVHTDPDYPQWLGKAAFTDRDPGFRPESGQFRCMLHTDSPDRERYDAMGLPHCRAGKLRSRYDVTRHMQHKHKDEWGIIEDERERAERREDREWQRSILERAVPGEALVAPEKFVAPTTPTVIAAAGSFTEICEQCGQTFTKDTASKARSAMSMHTRQKKDHNLVT